MKTSPEVPQDLTSRLQQMLKNQGGFKVDDLVIKFSESSIEQKAQVQLVLKILQRRNCPENLKFVISVNDASIKTIIIPIFTALASGKCHVRGLQLDLKEGDNVPSDVMKILFDGLKSGNCPDNLQLELASLMYDPINANVLLEALQFPSCSSGFQIKYNEYKELSGIRDLLNGKKHDEAFIRLRDKSPKGLIGDPQTTLKKLCTDGYYDRSNILTKIKNINMLLNKKLNLESSRLNEKDRGQNYLRIMKINTLKSSIEKICKEKSNLVIKISPDKIYELKLELLSELKSAIQKTLNDEDLVKKHTNIEYYGKKLLNMVMLVIFPLAITKYLVTGSAFFSTVGKSKEAVEETLNITNRMK